MGRDRLLLGRDQGQTLFYKVYTLPDAYSDAHESTSSLHAEVASEVLVETRAEVMAEAEEEVVTEAESSLTRMRWMSHRNCTVGLM